MSLLLLGCCSQKNQIGPVWPCGKLLEEPGSVVLGADDHGCVGMLALEHCSSVVAAAISCPEYISMDVLWSLGLYPHSAKKAAFVDVQGLG